MRYSGRRHVIGTLWSVYDDSAATVSAETYRRILQDGPPQADQVAEALHHATRAVRDAHPSRPSMWSQFVHTGL